MTDTENYEAYHLGRVTAIEFVNQAIPPLKSSDSLKKALNWMNEFHTEFLPLVESRKYLGLISQEILYDYDSVDKKITIGKVEIQYPNAFVTSNRHFFDVLKVANENKIDVVPILDEQTQDFVGVVSMKEMAEMLAQSLATSIQGGIIILSMSYFDYSLHQIGRLIEENDAKILTVYVEENPKDKSLINVTIKVNKEDLTRITATLERFGYKIVAVFQDAPTMDWAKERLGLLFKFLGM